MSRSRLLWCTALTPPPSSLVQQAMTVHLVRRYKSGGPDVSARYKQIEQGKKRTMALLTCGYSNASVSGDGNSLGIPLPQYFGSSTKNITGTATALGLHVQHTFQNIKRGQKNLTVSKEFTYFPDHLVHRIIVYKEARNIYNVKWWNQDFTSKGVPAHGTDSLRICVWKQLLQQQQCGFQEISSTCFRKNQQGIHKEIDPRCAS